MSMSFEQEKAEAEKRLKQMAEQNVYAETSSPRIIDPMTKKESGLLSSIAGDDLLLAALFVLLFYEDRENDLVMLLILALLLIS